jgi:DNA repair protein RadC
MTTRIISSSTQAANQLQAYMKYLDHEELWALYLAQDNRLISQEMLTKGSLTSTIIEPRSIIKRALLKNAVSVILLHNHPSGNPMPSVSDINQTAKIRMACQVMDIKLIDHLVIAHDSFFSFAEERTMKLNQ